MEYRIISFYLLSIFILSSVNSSAVSDAVKETRYCHWGPLFVQNKKACLIKCSASKGFIHPEQDKFICTDTRDQVVRRGISKFIGRIGQIIPCECQHPIMRTLSCDPEVKQGFRTFQECYDICRNYLILIFIQNKILKAYCVIASQIEVFELESMALWGYKPNSNGEFNPHYVCKCGVNMDKDVEKKLMLIDNKEKRKLIPADFYLPHLCRSGESALTVKSPCKKKCNKAKAFRDSDDELICYHDQKAAEVISSDWEDCECGMILNRTRKNKKRILPCYPKKTHGDMTSRACRGVCQKVIAYIFYLESSIPSLSYCDNNELPRTVIEGLEFQFARRVNNSSSPNNGDGKFSCRCGLNSLSRLTEKSSNETKANSTESPIRNIRYSCGTSSSQAVSNQGITHISTENDNSSPVATNQITNCNLIASSGSFGAVTDQRNTLKSINGSAFPSEANQTPNQNLAVPEENISWCSRSVRNEGITPNPNNRVSSFQAATNQISIEKSFGNERSSGSPVAYRRTRPKYNNKNDITLPPVVNQTSNRNLIGNTSSRGDVANKGFKPNSNKNFSSLLPAATRHNPNESGQISVINVSSPRAILSHRAAGNSNDLTTSSSRIVSNKDNNKRKADDRFADISDNSFVNSLDSRSFDNMSHVQSCEQIPSFDGIPVGYLNPSQFAQLPQSPLPNNTNAFNKGTSSLSNRNSFPNERMRTLPAATNENINNEEDIFTDVLNDDLINYPSLSLDGHLNPSFISNSEPVADLNFPLQFDDYI